MAKKKITILNDQRVVVCRTQILLNLLKV